MKAECFCALVGAARVDCGAVINGATVSPEARVFLYSGSGNADGFGSTLMRDSRKRESLGKSPHLFWHPLCLDFSDRAGPTGIFTMLLSLYFPVHGVLDCQYHKVALVLMFPFGREGHIN